MSGRWLPIALVVLCHTALHAGALRIGFVTDDFAWLAAAGRDRGCLEVVAQPDPFGYFRPCFALLLWLLLPVFGLDPVPYHVLSLAAGTALALLVYRLLCELVEDRAAAICGAALLVVHPAHALAVGWISAMSALLAMGFALAAVLAWRRFRAGRGRGYLAASLLCHALALGCKETGVLCLPWLVALEFLGRRLPQLAAADRRGGMALHGVVLLAYLALWAAVASRVNASTPDTLLGSLSAVLEPVARFPALLVPRNVVGEGWSHALLLVLFVALVRQVPAAARAPLCLGCVAGAALALAALLPSSVGLWRWDFDRYQRLLHEALPAAAWVLACAVRALRAVPGAAVRWSGAACIAVVLVLFAERSRDALAHRRDAGAVGARLLAGVREHEALLRRLAAEGVPVAVRGYPVDWVYPVAPFLAVAPELVVRAVVDGPAAPAEVVFHWNPADGRFAVAR